MMFENDVRNPSYRHIQTQVRRANIVLKTSDLQAALDIYSELLGPAKQMGRSPLVAVIFNRIGQVLQMQGEIQDAVVAYESALTALAQDDNLDLERVTQKLTQVEWH